MAHRDDEYRTDRDLDIAEEEDTMHTPGPWSIRCGSIYAESAPGIYEHICSGAHASLPGEWMANAHLIAAAPDLLAALQEIVSMDNCNYERDIMRYCGAFDRARAAIAKATQ